MSTPTAVAPRIVRPTSWTIALPPGLKLLNENETRRMHWRKKAELAAAIRAAAVLAGRQARRDGLPQLRACHVFYVIHPGPRVTRRDPLNWAQSAKPAVDGALVDAGIIPDDDSTRLIGPDARLGTPVKGSQLTLIVTDLDAMTPAHLALLNPPTGAPS